MTTMAKHIYEMVSFINKMGYLLNYYDNAKNITQLLPKTK